VSLKTIFRFSVFSRRNNKYNIDTIFLQLCEGCSLDVDNSILFDKLIMPIIIHDSTRVKVKKRAAGEFFNQQSGL
jgi:hypothetical protein